jgi:phosphoribosyl-AMP cyclohydrolase
MSIFKDNEGRPQGAKLDKAAILAAVKFNQEGLVPVIAQQFDTLEVLMLAWMNAEALAETLNTGRVCYWSRSRKALWRKGESSGQVQLLKSARIDCDGDTLLLAVDQTGPACHTGRRHCFFYKFEPDAVVIDGEVMISPDELYKK